MSDEFAPSAPASAPSPAPAPPAPASYSPPAGSPAPSSPASPAPSPVSAGSPAATPTGGGDAAALQQIRDLYGTPDDLRSALDFVREFRGELERAKAGQRQADPEYRAAAQRGATFRSLVAEGYSPEHADYIARLPELFQSNDMARAVQSQQDMTEELRDLGLTFDGTEGEERLQIWENTCSDYLTRDRRLNSLYFNPATRRQAIREIIQSEEKKINHVLLSQNAQTLRDAARRRQAAPAGRSAPATIAVREENPTAPYSDPAGRRRQHREITSRKLDDLLANLGR